MITELSNLPSKASPSKTTDILSTAISRLESIQQVLNSGESILMPENSETAITVSFYSAAWLLICTRINPNQFHNKSSSTFSAADQFALLHCDNILRAGSYLDDCRDGCGYIRMILPLRTVIELSPDLLQRESARYRLESWRVRRGLDGLCGVALACRS